ncbi:DEAD/DEAH box helicase [Bacteroides sp. 224]|uniref:DEAD/DEAH box helicase n=1 Tax=Bacteroides sp. 224 TaxID=2302936 RepID=UPI0013D2D1DA|nr:DEAD/DEAH box helicase [Bacteroides sp. 224]NDV65916.1 helicase SNF2 [Bacteroides sp. 224]
MSKYFGKTWWGQQWLNSLTHIDYSNRLPRGSAYAKKGSVKEITVEGNTIIAKVAGSSPRPYKVTIIVPAFSEKETKMLIQALAQKPVIISKLLNRELDPEVLTIAQNIGLKVFPRQWTDFNMNCNCPDWAVPCKHLAAVIYKISAEIDNDPFLVFKLHNVELEKELEKENIHVSTQNTIVPALKELLKNNKRKVTQSENNTYKQLDFSILQPISAPLIQLLTEAPVFYQNSGNFKDIYASFLKKAERNAQQILKGKVTLDSSFLITKHTDIKVEIDANNNAIVQVDGEISELSLQSLIAALWQIPAGLTNNYQPSVASLYTILQLSINLVANGAVIPQIVSLNSGLYLVRWLPAIISKPVKTLIEQLEHISIDLISSFMSSLIEKRCGTPTKDIFLDLFFHKQAYAFSAPGEKALPGGINSWIQRYFITQGNYRPSIVVDELEENSFRLTIEIETQKKQSAKKIPLRDILEQKKYEKIRFEVLQSLTHLSSFIPGVDDYINQQGKTDIILTDRDFAPFLIQAIPAIRLLDIDILLPKSLQQILRPKASIRIKSKAKDGKTFLRLDSLLDYDWQVAVGNMVMSESEFNKLLKTSNGLIKYKTNYIYVSPDDLEKLRKQFTSTKNLSSLEMLRIALSNEYLGAAISLSSEVKEMIRELTQAPNVALPQGLNATLRPYQQRGFSWMYRNSQIGFGSVLADDMGLGKTLQVIATLLKYKQEGAIDIQKALIVVPTGLLANWMAEFEKFAPSLHVMLYHGINRKLDKKVSFDILLTSYGIARSDTQILKKVKWQVIVIDEAQNIKNQDTAQSKAIKSIGANTCIAMSGTPVENRLSELWSIMDFANRGFLGSISNFKEMYANPIQNKNDLEVAGKLKLVTAPFMMRRLKTDKTIITDLPDKIEMDSYAHLTKEQASLYQQTLQEALAAIESMEGADHKTLFARQGLVLQMILALKQICNHPALFLKNRVLDATLSGKADLLFDKLDTIVDANEKVLIFTQFVEMGTMLKQFIADRYGETPLFYHGGCTLKQRKEMVDNFQNNRADKIFILSLKAAGTGLNLTAANHVIHYDLWWNPAVEAQATDRAYRIGQKSNVMVHRFITKGTFEEKINDMIQAKKTLANMTVSTGENWIGNLNDKELRSLFEL